MILSFLRHWTKYLHSFTIKLFLPIRLVQIMLIYPFSIINKIIMKIVARLNTYSYVVEQR